VDGMIDSKTADDDILKPLIQGGGFCGRQNRGGSHRPDHVRNGLPLPAQAPR
jgi:hypothetical protein